jgi:hypothetical protein
MQWGQGQLIREFTENPASREQLKQAIQNVSRGFFNNQGAQGRMPPPAPIIVQTPKRDYTPFLIAAGATILAALIVSQGRKK